MKMRRSKAFRQFLPLPAVRYFVCISTVLALLAIPPSGLAPLGAGASALLPPGGGAVPTDPEPVETDTAVIDVSNTNRGYVSCRYTGRAGRAVVVVNKSDNNKAYKQYVDNNGEYAAIPFLYGDGLYSIQIWEQPYGASYYMTAGTEVLVTLDDETLPFLFPNRVVPVKSDSLAVAKGRALTRGAKTDPEKISAIYKYIVDNIVYDDEKAAAIKAGYVSDPDETIKTRKGICIDYAVLAATMLRSQGIPTRVEVGYMADGTYHAWISVYSDRAGTINELFELREKNWTTLDPTYASKDEVRTAALLFSAEERGDYTAFFLY